MYCIYLIVNKINGKTYVGQHKYKKLNDNYMGSGKILKQSIKKYGIENFEKEILYSRIQYKETADDMERFAIAKERAIGKAEYNIADGGQGGALNKGREFSEEWKRNISEANKGKIVSDETRKKMSEANKGENNAMYGKHHSQESKRKMSLSRKGHNVSEETRMKISEGNKGKIVSDETKRKLSEINKGKKHSEESIKKMSETHKGHTPWNKGKHLSEEAKIKISESSKGRHFSEDHKRKIGESNRGKLKGKHWYNNGEINVLVKECPEGFVKGRLRVYH